MAPIKALETHKTQKYLISNSVAREILSDFEMGHPFLVPILLVFGSILSGPSYVEASIVKSMYINWGSPNSAIRPDSDNLQLILDQNSGDRHDEIDFEFLGNVSGQPYFIHTNIFTQGVGSREQQFHPWFDPTSGYHNYTIHWNPTEVVWYVDSLPIRVFKNYASEGIGYPNEQGMRVYTSIWDADNWATRGGLVKIDWTCAPFRAGFQSFRPRACKWNGPVSISQCAAQTAANWWTSPAYSQLSHSKTGQMKWVRDNYMIYDHCEDYKRLKDRCLLNAPNHSSDIEN